MGESIQAIHYHDDNIITQEKMGTVKLWTVKKSSYTMVTTYSGGVGFCKSVVLNNSLLVPQEDGGVDILDITSLEKVQRLMPEIESIGKLMCLESLEIDGNVCVLGGYESGDVVLWDMNSFKPCANIRLQEHITSITFDTDNGRGVVGGPSNILQMFEIDKSYKMILRSEISMTNEGVNIVKLRPDKKIMVTGGWDGRIRIYSWKTMRILVTLPEHKAAITDVQFSPCILSVWGC
ncbi:hypothetical protein NQ317_018244 [Molorchus minor]|uniref:Uncharacterized protein n=1 Tax=Molorchus minor TaxID=1323400 RepID=A0ABQ9K4F0_9CUCU|nr:hypothetical protein NQ317_018244 [Molorchus minor]